MYLVIAYSVFNLKLSIKVTKSTKKMLFTLLKNSLVYAIATNCLHFLLNLQKLSFININVYLISNFFI